MTKSWTIKALLQWTTEYFTKKSIETPRLDAELLLAHVLGLRKLDLYLQFDRPMNEKELAAFKQLIKRRMDHEPVAYLVGKKEFWSRDFFVNKDVLIPRPETEFLVEKILDHVKEKDLFNQELCGYEVGLGSGCLSITLLSELPQLKMQVVEISEPAIAVARKNAEYHGVSDRLEIIKLDFLASPRTPEKYDFLVANPPYIAETERSSLPQSVIDHEPVDALIADDEGLAFYPAIARFSKEFLKENGLVVVEIGENQAEAVTNFFDKEALLNIAVFKDYQKLDRVVVGYQNNRTEF